MFMNGNVFFFFNLASILLNDLHQYNKIGAVYSSKYLVSRVDSFLILQKNANFANFIRINFIGKTPNSQFRLKCWSDKLFRNWFFNRFMAISRI